MASRQIKTAVPKSTGSSPAPPPKPQSLTVPVEPQVLTLEALQQALKLQAFTLEEKITSAFEEKMKEVTEKMNEVTEEMTEIKDVIQARNKEIREDIIFAFQGLASHIEGLDERLEEINQSNVNLENKMGEVQTQMEKADSEVMMIQYRSMEFAIRVRGLKENTQENLREIFAEAFVQITEERKEDLDWQIDKIYRVNSWVARQRNLPRDIVIYFTTRRLRNVILQASYKNKLQVAGQEVLTLKEIPPPKC